MSKATRTSPVGRQVLTVFDDHARPTRLETSGLEPMQLAYDSSGRVASITRGTRVSTMTYDGRGQLASVTDPLSRTVRYEHDLADRVTRQTLADGSDVLFGYDANDNLTSVLDPKGLTTTYTYNGFGDQLTQVRYLSMIIVCRPSYQRHAHPAAFSLNPLRAKRFYLCPLLVKINHSPSLL